MGKKQTLLAEHNIFFENGKLFIEDNQITFANYKILDLINNGANAIILKAQGNIANEIVAIKIWIPNGKSDCNIQSIKEITKLANLNKERTNQNLIRYYASGKIENKDYYYCIMEYLDMDEYVTLREKCKEEMLLNEKYEILMNIVSGLRYAQENMIFHGDLHSDNVLIRKSDNTVKIIDFGTSFRNHAYSKQRDNKMTLGLAKFLLGKDWNDKLIVLSQKPETLPQNVVRLIVKTTAKIVVLLDFWEHGNVDTIVEDIAVFATLVPFFNLKFIKESLFKSNNVPEYFKEIFKEKLITQLYENTADVKFDTLEAMYIESQKRFIKLCEQNPCENCIYPNYDQAKLFNSPLYAKYFGQDERAVERQEIERVIE